MSEARVHVSGEGPRNVNAQFEGFIEGRDLEPMVLLDPTNMMPDGTLKPTQLRIDRVEYMIADGITVRLLWDAPEPKRILDLRGRGRIDRRDVSGINNDAEGKTGKIIAVTLGYTEGRKDFTVELDCVKQFSR